MFKPDRIDKISVKVFDKPVHLDPDKKAERAEDTAKKDRMKARQQQRADRMRAASVDALGRGGIYGRNKGSPKRGRPPKTDRVSTADQKIVDDGDIALAADLEELNQLEQDIRGSDVKQKAAMLKLQ